ncbi:MAG: hypothetical protein LBU87_05415 [Lactobacillales bacterium]|nr:hypothetical protein [Lactobacillales bacterium]
MKKILATVACLLFSIQAYAQLAADPWAVKSPLQDRQNRQIAYKAYPVRDNLLPVPTPNYVGQNTTWTTAKGQEMIAPDVNITNMLLMTQHLRQLGYQIPAGFDNVINTAPQKLRVAILRSMQELKSSSHPIALASVDFAKIVERNTGFSIENLITNSLRIIDERR